MKEVKIILPEFDEIFPEEFGEHMANAAKEILFAFRCLIDAGIEKVEALKGAKAAREIKKIEIE